MVKDNNGVNLDFEQKLWQAADKMRSNMDAAEYKHVVLGLIFLKYISDSFKEKRTRIVKASSATVKIPNVMTIEPGEAANGYVTNVEGILNRMKHTLEIAKDAAGEDEEEADKARNMLKKINKVIFGSERVKLILEDPAGNSAIISEKATKEPMKGKKKEE